MADEWGAFTFDTSFFENGMKRIERSMTNLPKEANQVAAAIGKGFNKATKKTTGFFKTLKKGFGKLGGFIKGIVGRFKKVKDSSSDMTKKMMKNIKGLALKVGVFALALKGLQGILKNMPEIGQALGIAKDIFLKNFLFPLRKLVFPYLQRLLDWVRDNRVRFVKWGQVVANIFRVVISSVKALIKTAKSLLSAFSGFFEKVFGAKIKSIEELFNILSFRAAVVITFLQKMFEGLFDRIGPSLESLGETISSVITIISEFVEGFIKGIAKIDKKIPVFIELNKTFKAFNKLLKEITPIIGPLGEIIGEVFGVTLVLAFRTLQATLLGIVDTIRYLKGEITGEEFLKNLKSGVINIGSTFKELDKGKQTTVHDAIIKPNGEIIRTDPNDTIIATKNNVKPAFTLGTTTPAMNQTKTENSKKIDINIDFSGMQIILQEGSPEEAKNIGEGIVEIIRQKLALELELLGV